MSRSALHVCAAAVVGLCAPFVGSSAEASPWVLDKGRVVVGLSAGTEIATREFLPNGTNQRFPLDGHFDAYFIHLDARWGIGHDLELLMRTQFKGVSYRSDAVLLPGDGTVASIDDARGSVYNFSQRALGLGDLQLGIAHQHVKAPFRLASSIEIKFPTGYRQPKATFNDDTPAPDQIGDDVTIGDGQVDVQYTLQTGYFVPRTRSLVQLDAGYRARFNGPGHQLTGQLKLGQLLSKYVLLYASVEGAYTLFDGNVIGSTFIAIDPDKPARAFTEENVQTAPLTLDRDLLTLGGGAILRFAKREWVLRVSHTLLGRNYAQLTSVSLGLLVSFN